MIQRQDNQQLTGLANHLVSHGLLTYNIALQATQASVQQQILFITYIVKNSILDSQTIASYCEKIFGLDYFDLSNFDTTWLTHLTITPELFHRYHIIPLFIKNNITHIGISDPTNNSILDSLAFQTGTKLKPVIVDENKLSQLLHIHYHQHALNNKLQLDLVKQIANEEPSFLIQENPTSYDEPLIKFTNNVINQAIHLNASDIHIETYEHIARIRYRQDGILYEASQIPPTLAVRLISRLKVLAKLDISERRLPQDGRFPFENYDIRINTCPTLHGEKTALRLLNTENITHEITSLGFTESQLSLFLNTITQPQGMILVTGPTGSGKTVTLYSALNYLNSPHKNISTVEDPIEIQLKGINQVNTHSKIGLTFSTILRALLRQDPDIIMVGEIRDTETAEIAIQAAQTGHLVFSTLHTNSAIDAITRLRAMGVPSYNIASSISLIIAQRLVRKLCSHCKQANTTSYSAIGCQFCTSGYKGRTGIFEMLSITPTIAQRIQTENNFIEEINDFISLKHAGEYKIHSGITTAIEINRVLQK